MSFTGFGVVAGADYTKAVEDAGADYVEPTIGGNLVVEASPGLWRRNEVYDGRRFPSFAILIPSGLSVFDADPARLDAYFAAALPIIGSVAQPGAKIVFGSGAARAVPDGLSTAEARAVFARVLRSVRDLADECGLRIVLEPLNRGETNLVNSIAEAVEFLDEAEIEGIDVVADFFHIQTEAESFDVVRQHAARIGHVHVADSGRVAVGKADGPWRTFLGVLHDGGYRGTVSLECNWGPDAVKEMRASLALLRRVDAEL